MSEKFPSLEEWTEKHPHWGECASCGWETENLTAYTNQKARNFGHEKYNEDSLYHWICNLCASTITSTALSYPAQIHDVQVLQTICYVGNAILAALRPSKEEKNSP